jgi:hypothetical protein
MVGHMLKCLFPERFQLERDESSIGTNIVHSDPEEKRGEREASEA